MRKRWFNSAMAIALAAIVGLTFVADDAFARGGRSGGGYSSSRSSSRSSMVFLKSSVILVSSIKRSLMMRNLCALSGVR